MAAVIVLTGGHYGSIRDSYAVFIKVGAHIVGSVAKKYSNSVCKHYSTCGVH